VNGTVNGNEITLNTAASGKNIFKKAPLQKPGSFFTASYRASSVPRDNDRDAMRAKSLVPQIVTQLRRTLLVHGRASQAVLNEMSCAHIGCPTAVHHALRTWAEGQSQSLSSTRSVASAAIYVASERLEYRPNEGRRFDFNIPTSPGVILFLSGGEWRELEAWFSRVEEGIKNVILVHHLNR
jgi:hypothetical protein